MNSKKAKRLRRQARQAATNFSGPIERTNFLAASKTRWWPEGTQRRIYQRLKEGEKNR